MMSMVLLGIFMYGLIAGDDDESVLSTMHDLWAHEIEVREKHP